MPHADTSSQLAEYHYLFKNEAGEVLHHRVCIDPATSLSLIDVEPPYPFWTEMDFLPCSHCEGCSAAHCPAALRLIQPIALFGTATSFDKVEVTVHAPERVYYKQTDMQDGLRSLFGLLMATSGCPSMEPFRMLARYHLPFASFEENLFRVLSSQLVGHYFRQHEGQAADSFDLEGIKHVYERVGQVNASMVTRLKQAVEKDASLNAVVVWDSMSSLMTFSMDTELEKLKHQWLGSVEE